MRNLDLRDNKCDYVHENVFTSMVSLEILHMERNSLSYLFTGRYGKQIFTGLNNLKELFITDNNVESISDSLLKDQINLKVLKMDRNKISGWGPNMFRFTKNLKKLDISHNQILFLDKDRLQHLNQLEEINFRDNPFACNCYLLWFREWIDRTSVQLAYKETYKCRSPEEWRGKQLMTFSRDKINCEDLSKYIIVGSVSGTLLVSVLTVTFLYRSRWRLRLRIYLISKRGKLFLRMLKAHARMGNNYGAINGNQGLYDAYISSSEYDNDWVRLHLLPGIDDGKYHDDTMFGGDFKLYYDPRDFDPGVSSVANIFEHMSRSRKVIVVLTQHYWNGMNEFELDQATTMYHEHDLDDIIVIKVGDVPPKRIPAHLYKQMRNDTFLEWEDDANAIRTFKEKLKERLQTQNEHAN